MPSLLVLREGGDARPRALGRGAHEAEDLLELVFVCGTWKEWPAAVHFGHDAAGGPDVDAGVVGAGAKEDVRGAVPERHHFVAEGVDRDAESSRQAEIRELELPLVVDEEVLRFEIAMQDTVFVTERYPLQ